MKWILTVFLAFSFVHCTNQHEKSPTVVRLEKDIAEMEHESKKLDDQIKDAAAENAVHLTEQKELLKSRMERAKELLKAETKLIH